MHLNGTCTPMKLLAYTYMFPRLRRHVLVCFASSLRAKADFRFKLSERVKFVYVARFLIDSIEIHDAAVSSESPVVLA